MKPQRIQRRRTKGWRMSPGTVYVGRPSIWGNPFDMQRWGRRLAVQLYKEAVSGGWNPSRFLLLSDTDFHEALAIRDSWLKMFRAKVNTTPKDYARVLAGHNLACWCPIYDKSNTRSPCHADILLQIANGWPDDEACRLLTSHRKEMQQVS